MPRGRKKVVHTIEIEAPEPAVVEASLTRYEFLLGLHSTLKREGFNSISDVENALAKAQREVSA